MWGRRLTSPLVRNGGIQEPTRWRTALRSAAERLTELLAAGAPIGVLGSARATNEENFLAVRLARTALRTHHVDSCLQAPYQSLVSGVSESDMARSLASALEDIERCEVILLLEGDLAVTHPQVASAIMTAARRGATLVTMGPVKTQMSRLAWLHLPLIPGDEPVLAARLVAASDGATLEHAAKAVAAHPPTDSRLSPEQLMPVAGLGRAVEAYKAARSAAIVLGSSGTANPWLRAVASGFAKLAASTGHLQRPGSVVLPLPLLCNTRGALEMGAAPHCLPGRRALDDESARLRLRRVWGCEVASQRGLDVEAMLDEVKGLVVVADDPPLALLSQESGRKALAGLECLVVLDAFVTPTVEASHIALPISSLAEADGTVTSMEGRVQWLRGGRPPPGEARPGWWVLSELGAALGMSKTCQSVRGVFHDILAAVPEYAEALSPEGGRTDGSLGVLPGILGDPRSRSAESADACDSTLAALRVPVTAGGSKAEFPYRLARVGSFEWGEHTYVDSSPTLSRDHRSRRKLYPDGYIEMSTEDASRLGVRDGWRIKVMSARGEVVIPVRLREAMEPGILLVPFAFRDQLEPVLKRDALTAVNVERT